MIPTIYDAKANRYEKLQYRRSGNSGILLPAISLGLWQNFGSTKPLEDTRNILRYGFDNGIVHFDLANNYGPPYGSAEETFGEVLRRDFGRYRDELFISTKAGYDMWPGPYGNWGSRKYLLSSLDQSLSRMGLEYVDVFYSHRFDPNTPLEETMGALDTAVRSGKALYAGISSYSAEKTLEAIAILKDLGTPLFIHQPSYSILNRWIEEALLDVLSTHGVGCIAFSPLAQGILSEKYLSSEIPDQSRAADSSSLDKTMLNEQNLEKVRSLSGIAKKRGQTLPQMAIAWVLRDPRITSALIGVRNIEQLKANIAALENTHFDQDELAEIDKFSNGVNINLWEESSSYK